MAQLLVQVINVTALAGGGTVTVAHDLESNDVAVAPTLVFWIMFMWSTTAAWCRSVRWRTSR